jgi:hypothetical protein
LALATGRAKRICKAARVAAFMGFGDAGCYNDQSAIPTPEDDQLVK